MLNFRARCATVVVVTLLVSALASCGVSDDNDELMVVSMVQLLSTPDRFEGKQVRVRGFLESKMGLKLYLTKDHAIARDYPSSLMVSDDTPGGSLTLSDCSDHYVQVTGKFDRLEGVRWAIVRVDEVLRTDTIESCWKR